MLDESADSSAWIHAAVDRYEGPLLRYAQRITGELESARDVVQEAFLRLCREQRANVEDHLAQWLFTVCRRRALDVVKKESRMKTSTNGVVLDGATHAVTLDAAIPDAATPGVGHALEQRETASQVLDLLERLPPNQQEVIRLKFQAGLSYREISNVTNLSVTNVGYLIHTALQTLRRQMAPSASL